MSSDEELLLRQAFGSDWKREITLRLNQYDVTREWPAYERDDGLGLFAAAILDNELPIIGHGKRAHRMTLADSIWSGTGCLSETQGLARYLNSALNMSGLQLETWQRTTLIEIFSGFEKSLQQILATLCLFEVLLRFYKQLAEQWLAWSSGADESPGTVSPISIWSNYVHYELWPLRSELEAVLDMMMHTPDTLAYVLARWSQRPLDLLKC